MNDARIQQIKARVLPLRSSPLSDLTPLETALIFDAAYLLDERTKLVSVVNAAREIVQMADGPYLAHNWATDRLLQALAELDKGG